MATTNVKILLRRGFRNEIGNDTLETGEMGFATDTNQLYIGIDKAINEVRFDPFANAQSVIQSWLDSADNPEPGLKVDEDLVIRQVTDVDALLDAMNFFVQTVTFDTISTTFTPGHTLNQKYNKELTDPAQYVIYETGEILSTTVTATTTEVTVKISESGRFDEVGQFYTPGGFRGVADVTKTLTADINDASDPLITPVSSVEISDPALLPDDYYIPETIDVNNGVDAEYQLTRANADYTYVYDSTNKKYTITFATPIADGKVQQEQIGSTSTLTGDGTETQFNLLTYPDPAPSSVVVKDSGGNVLATPADYEIYDQNHANYNGVVEEIKFTTAPAIGTVTIEYNENVDVDENARVDTLKVNFSDNGAFIYETVDTADVATDLSSLVTVAPHITGGSDFRVNRYAGARRNVEVVTENSFNQMFADQHLEALDASTGLRSSLFNKELKQRQHGPDKLETGLEYKILVVGTNTDAQANWNTVAGTTGVTYAVGDTFTATSQVAAETNQGSAITNQGTFLKYPKNDCTSFFIDYSLKQADATNTYVRVGQIKAINGVPQGINQVKLSDDNTEIWQDDGDNIAEADEFSNITFTATIVGDDVIFKFTQDYDFETNISFTVKRWTM